MLSEVQTFLQEGGRIFRRREGFRTITVAYRRDESGNLAYGATIHRQEPLPNGRQGASFHRKPHNETAVLRALKHPIVVPDLTAAEDKHPFEREQYLRGCLMRLGCRAKEAAE